MICRIADPLYVYTVQMYKRGVVPNIKHHQLSDEMVKTVSKHGTYSDGKGLTLRVQKSGSKQWVQRVTIGGKARTLGLGGYPGVGLAEARRVAQENLKAIRQGRDPIQERRIAREQLRTQVSIPTFRDAAVAVIEKRKQTWRSDRDKQWARSLEKHVYPFIGDKRVDEITTAEVTDVVKQIWTQRPETARRILQRVTRTFDHAVLEGWRDYNPAGRAVTAFLPKPAKELKHHSAVDYRDVASVISSVRGSNARPTVRLAFEFMVLTVARSGEARLAQWDEMDLANRVRLIPAHRTKMGKLHRVPLTDRALEILTQARALTDGEGLVFPSELSVRKGAPAPMPSSVFTKLMQGLEIPGVPHGFRASFWQWAMTEQQDSRVEALSLLGRNFGSEFSLDHFRFRLLESQRLLLQNWSTLIETGESPPFK